MNAVRPSYYVARYLSLKKYEVVPVNPGHAGRDAVRATGRRVTVRGRGACRHGGYLPPPEHVPPIVDEALEAFPDLQTIWMQIGVEHAGAAAKARARGVDVVMNHCPKIEYQRLFGELRMGGFNTGVISSKL